MSNAVLPVELATDPETGLPVFPPREVWLALTQAQRDVITEAVMDAMREHELTLPPEGTPHYEAQRDAMDRFRRHLDRTRKGVFVAANLLVSYPGESGFAPDLLAVLDAPLHDRMSWDVNVEGKGPDFVLEILFSGDAKKDLRRNVAWFARLGIPEYFVFDGGRRQLRGWRLADDGSGQYLPVTSQAGRYASRVLGLELAVVQGQLRLFQDGAVILGTSEEIALLSGMLDEALVARGADAERAEREAERARQGIEALQASFRAVCSVRGWTLEDELAARLAACDEPSRLGEWILRATRAETRHELTLD